MKFLSQATHDLVLQLFVCALVVNFCGILFMGEEIDHEVGSFYYLCNFTIQIKVFSFRITSGCTIQRYVMLVFFFTVR